MPRDLTRVLARIEEKTFRKPTEATPHPKPAAKAAVRTWHAVDAKPSVDAPKSPIGGRQAAVQPRKESTLTARSVKITVPLDPAEVLRLPAPEGQPRAKFSVVWDDGTLSTHVATKSVRKAQTMIKTNGIEGVFVMLQGKLGRGEVKECGLVAQPKTPPKIDP